MESKLCPKSEKCPIYGGVLKNNEMLTETYKTLYCENGEEGTNNCKRYQVSSRIGSCPPDLLPNSKLTVDEIVAKISNTSGPSCG